MIYVDDTALVAMVWRTAAGWALAHLLNQDMTQAVVTSVLSEVEVEWALRENEPALVTGQGLLRQVSRYDVDDEVRRTATAILQTGGPWTTVWWATAWWTTAWRRST